MRDVGHVMSNPNKVRVLEVLRKREKADLKEISKLTRIPEVMLKGIMNDLERDGFVREEGGVYKITPEGVEVLMKIC